MFKISRRYLHVIIIFVLTVYLSIYLFGPRFEAFIVLPVFSGLHQSLVLCSIWFSFSGYIYDMCNTAVKLISSLTGRLLFSYSYSWVQV